MQVGTKNCNIILKNSNFKFTHQNYSTIQKRLPVMDSLLRKASFLAAQFYYLTPTWAFTFSNILSPGGNTSNAPPAVSKT